MGTIGHGFIMSACSARWSVLWGAMRHGWRRIANPLKTKGKSAPGANFVNDFNDLAYMTRQLDANDSQLQRNHNRQGNKT